MKLQHRKHPYVHTTVELNENEVRNFISHFVISAMEFDSATMTAFEWIVQDGTVYGARLQINPGGPEE
jgi:hypothetical protein